MKLNYPPTNRIVRWIAGIAGSAVLLVGAACSDGSSTPEASPEPTTEPTPQVTETREPSLRIIPLGRTATNENAAITINGHRSSRSEGDERAPDDYMWQVFDMTVANTGTEPFDLYASLYHPDGREFERAYPSFIEGVLDGALAEATEVRGEIAFLVERGTSGTILIYGPGGPTWALELGMPVDNQR